jgi:tryptophan synthase alpha chain
MNRLKGLFDIKQSGICSIFVTAGFPDLDSTVETVLALEQSGVDMVELGMPFSDPLADGETIQRSSAVALKNGMNLDLLFDQINEIRNHSRIPIVLMGYANPVFKYGIEKFLSRCKGTGVDGLIIPDISLEEYELNFKELFQTAGIPMTFLVTPKTSTERIRRIDALSETFIYFVSSASTTGKSGIFSEEDIQNFKQLKSLKLSSPILMGFGIHDQDTFDTACTYFNGAIIGSAFIRALESRSDIPAFIGSLKEK